jgi:outer membrane protein OmpA-like peptidoglycan-associated protein
MVLGLVVAMAACGCKKNPVGVTRLPGSTAGKPTDTTRANPVDTSVRGNSLPTDGSTVGSKPVDTTYGIAPNAAGSHEGWIEDVAALKADTVYFDFDSAVVKSSEKSKVSAVADYLKAHPSAAVRVEGNCDARGTEEYNRALGERWPFAKNSSAWASPRARSTPSATAKIGRLTRAMTKPPGRQTVVTILSS